MWLKAPNIHCVHGFSTRQGGISATPFNSLNLGGSEDDPANILKNRARALAALGIQSEQVAFLKQVHGIEVCTAQAGAQTGDALVTNQKDLALAVSVADCYPILFHDPVNHVIGAAHAGWRGTVAGIAARVLKEMKNLGAQLDNIQAALGQGISCNRFEVGVEVLQKFRDANFPEFCFEDNHIDLVSANRFIMEQEGLPAKNIWSLNRCSFEDDFFSYRRDKGKTGRMWGLIMLKKQ